MQRYLNNGVDLINTVDNMTVEQQETYGFEYPTECFLVVHVGRFNSVKRIMNFL